MNTKLLVAATLAASLASTLALADQANQPLSRAQVEAQVAAARADGTLNPSEYNLGNPQSRPSSVTRAQVIAAIPAKRVGTLANASYNPFGAELSQPSALARAQVKAELTQAIANGSLQRTDFDFDRTVAHKRVQMQAE